MDKERAGSLFEDLRSFETPEERVRRFYDQHLTPSLSSDVTKAETARQQGDHLTIDKVDDR